MKDHGYVPHKHNNFNCDGCKAKEKVTTTTKSISISSVPERPKYILRDILHLYMFDQDDSVSLQLDFKRSVLTPAKNHLIGTVIYTLSPDVYIEDIIPEKILDAEVSSFKVDSDVLVVTMMNYPLLDMNIIN